MVQLNEFYRLFKKCNECQKRRLMSIIWKMKCSHIVGPSPNRNHYHHSEVKKRQELSVDPEYRMSDDAAKIYHFTTCRKLSTQRGKWHTATPDGATVVLRRGEWCEETCDENDQRENEDMKEAVVRFSRKTG